MKNIKAGGIRRHPVTATKCRLLHRGDIGVTFAGYACFYGVKRDGMSAKCRLLHRGDIWGDI